MKRNIYAQEVQLVLRKLLRITAKSALSFRPNLHDSFIHSFYFTEHKLHKNNIKNKRTKSVPQDRKASGTNNCPYRHKHKTQSKKHKANE